MEIQQTSIPGLLRLVAFAAADARGLFVKTFQNIEFQRLGLPVKFTEEYFSLSHQGVVRGLHFQTPPYEHDKIVYCGGGKVLDAVVDLRRGSPTFHQHAVFELTLDHVVGLFIPAGLAHGFLVQEGPALMLYKVTSAHEPAHDRGVHWDSAGITWPVGATIVSSRDAGFPRLQDYTSPFVYRDVTSHER